MDNAYETILSVNLRKLEENYNYLKSKLLDNCKIIAVVKAYAYGHGDKEISMKLESLGVRHFWVADFEEGVNLRRSGIQSNIIVSNPGMKSFEQIIANNLDVVIHNHCLLDYYMSKKREVRVHIKLNAGMNRYGFNPNEVKNLASKLQSNKFLKIQSICSHLSDSDDPHKIHSTLNQIKVFETAACEFINQSGLNVDKHILNSSGLIFYPEHQFNMVRIGIGLYGSGPDKNLSPISSLYSVISENRTINPGESVGYSSGFIANKKMNVSVVPVGYADGINRRLGNNIGKVVINGGLCPIIGNVSMDSFIVDTTSIPCKVGDQIEIFGEQNSVLNLSASLNTIPYEIYATLNRRIKRVYLY